MGIARCPFFFFTVEMSLIFKKLHGGERKRRQRGVLVFVPWKPSTVGL